jgi:hypothetical protein
MELYTISPRLYWPAPISALEMLFLRYNVKAATVSMSSPAAATQHALLVIYTQHFSAPVKYPVKRESHMYSKGPTMPETSVDPNDAVRDWHRQIIGLLAELGNVFFDAVALAPSFPSHP